MEVKLDKIDIAFIKNALSIYKSLTLEELEKNDDISSEVREAGLDSLWYAHKLIKRFEEYETSICYTYYKIRTYIVHEETLSEINMKLENLCSDTSVNDKCLDQIWDNIQEIKSYLRKQNERSTDKGADSTSDKLGY